MAKSSKPTHPAPKSAKPAKPAPKAAPKPAAKAATTKPAPKAKAAAAPPPSGKKPTTPAKAPAKPAAAKPPAKAPEKSSGKAPAAKAPTKAASPTPPAAAPAAAGAAGGGGKTPPKGITIVSNKPVRKPKPKKLEMPVSEPLLKQGIKWKPLITSGPKAPPSSGIPGVTVHKQLKSEPKAKLNKKELDYYRAILLKKRAELLGDIDNMEDGALRQNSSGSLSSMPQHMADQGSDTFEQSMSLSLVDVDRNLIREIDDALKRILDGSYGVCLHTGRRIPSERLEQVPWTKYTIEAARELERKPIFVRDTSYAERAPSSKSENL